MLIYTSATASKDIYAGNNPKDLNSRGGELDGLPTAIILADDRTHSRHRRLLAHAFSAKALHAQEPLIQRYVTLLIQELRKRAMSDEGVRHGPGIDMVAWYNYTTFDVIGDLSFGSSFKCLENGSSHPWINTIFDFTAVGEVIVELKRWTSRSLIQAVLPKGPMNKFRDYGIERVSERLRCGEQGRPDFTSFMLKNRGEEKDGKISMSDGELVINAMVLVAAGSETTATLLSGLTFYLLRNPETLGRAIKEVREAFKSEKEITFASSGKLEYLMASLSEALRIHPPVPGSLARVTVEGKMIDGRYVPPGTSVSVYQLAAHYSPENFAHPERFAPERWLEHPPEVYAKDQKEAAQPFSMGPRVCIGRNLAYVEMRLIMARLLFNFDLELVENQENWIDQKIYLIWQKRALMVRLKPVAW